VEAGWARAQEASSRVAAKLHLCIARRTVLRIVVEERLKVLGIAGAVAVMASLQAFDRRYISMAHFLGPLI